jgi:hypothetical protein
MPTQTNNSPPTTPPDPVLTKREWQVLRDAAGFPTYSRSPGTCRSLMAKGLMCWPPDKSRAYFVVTDAGRALIARADDLQRRILEETK